MQIQKGQVEDVDAKGTSLHYMRESNRLLILNYMREHHAVPRADIARYTGLSRTTIGNIIDELVKEGLVSEGTGGDRRAIPLHFNAKAGYALGCALGRNHLTLLLTDLSATIVFRVDMPFPTMRGPYYVLPSLTHEFLKIVEQQHITWDKVIGLGLGIVGPLDPLLEGTSDATTLAGWAGVKIKQTLQAALNIPVHLDNNGHMGTLGESRYGAGRDVQDMLYVKMGSGIAGGFILNGQLYRGSSGSAGEIGHIPVESNGTLCHCGHYGCLETVAGARGILTEAQRLYPNVENIPEVLQAAREGNLACLNALERAGKYMGFALAGLINAFNPSLIVLDGSTMQAGDLLLRPLLSTLEVHSLQSPFAHTRVVLSECDGRAIALGGIATVIDNAFSVNAARNRALSRSQE